MIFAAQFTVKELPIQGGEKLAQMWVKGDRLYVKRYREHTTYSASLSEVGDWILSSCKCIERGER